MMILFFLLTFLLICKIDFAMDDEHLYEEMFFLVGHELGILNSMPISVVFCLII